MMSQPIPQICTLMSSGKFNTGEPLAYFITWTTYGTWLPGDDRGWNRKGELEDQPPDALFHEAASAHMKESPFLLSEADRQVVAKTIRDHGDLRGWNLHAVNVRSNPVHVVVTAREYKPETVASQFKAWCTKKLRPSHPDRKRFWTEGASRRWINREDSLTAAIEYILAAQDRKGVNVSREVSGRFKLNPFDIFRVFV